MKIRTAESVSPKHPDKICDQISDSILDEALSSDPSSRVAIETVGGHKLLLIIGEITTKSKIDYESIARRFVDKSYTVKIHVKHQSPEIAQGVDSGGAGDQGIMVGYATNETENLMPLEVDLSRSLNRFIYSLYPFDGKTQVTLVNDKIQAIVASFQNTTTKDLGRLVKEWLSDKKHLGKPNIFVNPAGNWDIGGFDADTGLTGRKIAVDSYGPHIPIGGGAFSGKDASKVDRSAAYMARKIAVDHLRENNAAEVYCKLAYAIGVVEPVEASVVVDGVEKQVVGYDLSPRGITKFLSLNKPQFFQTAQYGHFGNNFEWDN